VAVIATTVRLWMQRRVAGRSWDAQARSRLVAVLMLAAISLSVGLATVTLSPGGVSPSATGTRSGLRLNGQEAGAAAPPAPAVVRRQAAIWVSRQVSEDTIIACDPAMCAALQAAGVPARHLAVLRPGRAHPIGADVVIGTSVVRSQLGRRLAGMYAPANLADFGSGADRIDIRAGAPDGAAAYRSALAADVNARTVAGSELAHNSRIQLSAAARNQLVTGRVDSRLLAALATLAALHRVAVFRFGDVPRGASPGIPLRSAVIGPGGIGTPFRTLSGFLRAQRPPYRPSAITMVRIPRHRAELRIQYPVPSPLGLLGPRG
jgi:hypothetical protein